MTETLVTKRLHVSGLTPAISASDIQQRLSTFGTVKAIDGFGLLDGVGQPRKFGYVTIETTANKLARCMNLLSGSTWKGTKLRIGEAKPDYAERYVAMAEEPPKKKRRRFGATVAEDMSLVTPENVTPLGRILRPMRMRPERPLPPVLEPTSKATRDKKLDSDKPKKKRVKEPDSRARRRTIDVTKWGSTQLKGIFLELDVPNVKTVDVACMTSDSESARDSDADDEAEITEPPVALAVTKEPRKPVELVPLLAPTPSTNSASRPSPPLSGAPLETSTPTTKAIQELDIDIAMEKSKSLNLLASLFGDDDNNDWVGRESIGSDIDEESLLKRNEAVIDEDDVGFETVPLDTTAGMYKTMEVDTNAPMKTAEKPSSSQPANHDKVLIYDTGGFSLLGHLDLDLELDEEVPFSTEPVTAEPIPQTLTILPLPAAATAKPYTQAMVTLNPKQALFFPLSKESQSSMKVRPKDLFDLAKENGWNWRDPKVGFFKNATEDGVRKEWEEKRGDLTQDWKRRWREAGRPVGNADGE
ncbi:hypothetical protein BDQ17DRAFT_1352940 [Cyathus striatus]|nr:hypothetical protein BDQ17DRAFT_1352940 [Cyathus striatus]